MRLGKPKAHKMLEALFQKLEALLNEHASAAVLRQHLALLAEQVALLQRQNDDLRFQAQQAQAQAQECQARLDRFAKDNPQAWRCDACGSVDMARTGSRPDPTFADLGIKQALMTCRLCGHVSGFTLNP
jgi:ElaB/YqjD/DUF883 family membrane-anchored ribosome-binding protein